MAQWLSTGFSCGRPGFDIMAGPPLEVLKINKKKVLPLSQHLQMVRLFFNGFYGFFKDYKPQVLSHNSFESQLCGTLKNPHTMPDARQINYSTTSITRPACTMLRFRVLPTSRQCVPIFLLGRRLQPM